MTRKECLDAAAECVLKDRNSEYGEPEDSFGMIAGMWTAYLGVAVDKVDVAMMMGMLKMARIRGNKHYGDGYIDLAGYAACAAECSGIGKEVPPWAKLVGKEAEEFARKNPPEEPEGNHPENPDSSPKFKRGDKVQVATSEEAKEWHDATYVSFCQMNRNLWRHEVEYADGGRRYVPREWIRPMPKAEGCEALVEKDAPQTPAELYDKIIASNPATFGRPRKPTGEELAEMAEEEPHG